MLRPPGSEGKHPTDTSPSWMFVIIQFPWARSRSPGKATTMKEAVKKNFVRSASLTAWCALGLAVAIGSSACNNNDTGDCCRVSPGRDGGLPPQPTFTDAGLPINDIRVDPAFICRTLTCVSFQGTEAYCTEECERTEDCPEGFSCQAVLQSSAGPDAGIRPDQKFCVKAPHECQ
jgi:hypothetical protein